MHQCLNRCLHSFQQARPRPKHGKEGQGGKRASAAPVRNRCRPCARTDKYHLPLGKITIGPVQGLRLGITSFAPAGSDLDMTAIFVFAPSDRR